MKLDISDRCGNWLSFVRTSDRVLDRDSWELMLLTLLRRSPTTAAYVTQRLK